MAASGQDLKNKFNKDLTTNFPQVHTDMKNNIMSCNLTLKITLSGTRKKKWRKFKRKTRVMITPGKSIKVSDFVEVALECSKYVNVTGNRKHRKSISKDSLQERNDGSLTNDNLNNFSENKEAVMEE